MAAAAAAVVVVVVVVAVVFDVVVLCFGFVVLEVLLYGCVLLLLRCVSLAAGLT